MQTNHSTLTVPTQHRSIAEQYFRHHAFRYQLEERGEVVHIHFDPQNLDEADLQRIRLQFKYLDLFTWYGAEIDDVVFWERADLFDEISADFQLLTGELAYDLLAPLEARGFLLAGMLAARLNKPILPVRKYKPFFDRFPGIKMEFTNWKGEAEALFAAHRDDYAGKRVLIVDDLIETGNSLEAAVKLLEQIGCQIVGAFYLCEVLTPEVQRKFTFPIFSFVTAF
jgi:adenine/guanine phosphoribosyltransferase-like PRPP-binding protein